MGRKRVLVLLTSVLMLTSLGSAFSGAGSGTQSDPYEISTLSELNETRNDLSAYYELVSDIDATPTKDWNSGKGWNPIGNNENYFDGSLDGNFHTIQNLTINRPDDFGSGFFDTVEFAEIGNLSLEDINYTVDAAGGLAGEADATSISKVRVTGNIDSNSDYTGGLIGLLGRSNDPEVMKSYVRVDIQTEETGKVQIGGISGEDEDLDISEAYSTGRFTLENSGDYSKVNGLAPEGLYGSANGGYWDTKSSTAPDSELGTGLNNVEMRNKSKLPGLDFTNTWEYVNGTNDNYPVLQDFNREKKAPEISKEDIEVRSSINGTPDHDVSKKVYLTDGSTGATSWNWSWGDGTNDYYETFKGEYVNHSYSTPGQYTVNVTITNSEGKDSAEITLDVNNYFEDGTGLPQNPFEISTLEHLNNTRLDLTKSYELVSDINATPTENWNNGKGWKPIGGYDNHFRGKFDGNYHTIENLSMDKGTEYPAPLSGLFNTINGYVGKFSLKNINFTAYNGGGLAIQAADNAFISEISLSGNITGNSAVGGLVQRIADYGYPRIEKSYTKIDILLKDDSRVSAAGIMEDSEGRIEEVYSTGKIEFESGEPNDIETSELNGIADDLGANVVDAYWDTEGRTISQSEQGTELKTWEFSNTSKLSGFDFTNTWEFRGSTNNGYPVLQGFNRAKKAPEATILFEQLTRTSRDDFSTNEPVKFHDGLSGGTNYEWNLGDGTTTTEENFNHTYSSPGSYTVTLNVSNSEGWDTTSRDIEVYNWPCTSGTLDSTCTVNRTWKNIGGTKINGTGNLVMGSNGSLQTSNLRSFEIAMDGDVVIKEGSSIKGNVNLSAENLEIKEGSSINTTGLGYKPASGPGQGQEDSYDAGAGAGYGGKGGNSYDANTYGGSTYGSLTNPTRYGSGGGSGDGGEEDQGGAGGGRIKLNITQNTKINGKITANGENAQDNGYEGGGGGSGGAILIKTNNIKGNGNIKATGGNGTDFGGGGGGGRISLQTIKNDFKGIFIVSGGKEQTSGYDREQPPPKNGTNGTFFRCNGYDTVSCPGNIENSKTNLSTELNKTANGMALKRNVSSKWSSGFLEWTENISLTNQYDNTWTGTTQANYTINNLIKNLDFKALKDDKVIETENSGPNGKINFTTTLTNKHKFEILESVNPEYSNLKQKKDTVGLSGNNLSVNVSDVGSGVTNLYLETNESGIFENRTEYTKNLNNIKDSTEKNVSWSGEAFDGEMSEVKWKFYIKDQAGNWNSTDYKKFTVDGVDPALNNLDFDERVDVDDGSTTVDIEASDSSGVDSVILEEDSTGSKINYTLSESGGTYSKTISKTTTGDVDFKIYANDTVGNTEILQDTVQFQNLSVSQNLNTSEINASESIGVSGVAKLLPEDVRTDGEFSVLIDEGDGFESRNSGTVNVGDYSSSFTSKVAGTHKAKVNVTNSNSISGFETSKFNVSLNISGLDNDFTETGTNRLDVDESNQEINLTSYVSNSTDADIEKVWVDVEAPDLTEKRFYLNNQTLKNKSQRWYKSIDLGTEFSGQSGNYTVAYAANTTRGIGSNRPETSFYVENISLEQNKTEERIQAGDKINVSGEVLLQPYGTPVTGENVSVYSNGTFVTNITTNSSGIYSGQVSPVEKTGNLSLTTNISYRDIGGLNETEIQSFNLTANITDSQVADDGSEGSPDQIFRDEKDGNIDLDLRDNISLSSDSPGDLDGVSATYELPDGWSAVNNNSALGTIQNGSYDSNSPDIDIGPNSGLGRYQINLSAVSDSDVGNNDSIDIEVWSKSQPEFVDLPDTIPRSRDYFPVKVNVTDYVKDKSYENIDTQLEITGSNFPGKIKSSNSSGIAVFNWSVKDETIGSYSIGTNTKTNENIYVEGSDISSKLVNIQGILYNDSFTGNEDPVYRSNDSADSTTTLTPTIVDSTGSGVDDATVNFSIAGKKLSCTTSGGSCGVDYNPPDTLSPGVYDIEVSASKDGFDELKFNKSIEVRGELDISQDSTRDIYTRGRTYELNSTVLNETDEETIGDVRWKLNGSKIKSGEDITWRPDSSISRGRKDLAAETNRSFFDYDKSSREVEVYGRAEVGGLYPSSSTILPGSNINVTADILDVDTGDQVEDMPVKFLVNGTEVSKNTTDSSGDAFFNWTPSTGYYNITAKISDNNSINYNVTDDQKSSIVKIGKETVLESFQITEEEIFRSDLKETDSTTFKMNLSETSSTDQRVPADNISVEVKVNGTETVSCETNELGYCEAQYNPTDVDIGNLTVEVTTDRTGWEDVDYNSSLLVKGVLFTTIDKPSENKLFRGNTVDLEASTTSGGESVDVTVNWSFRGEKIADGRTPDWSVPLDTDLGAGELEAVGGGDLYEESSETSEIDIFGRSNVEIKSPDNSSGIGYGETPQVRCEVTDGNQLPIQDYPVEFVQNGSTFGSSSTDSSGEASSEWDVPDTISTYEVGCRISDNSSMFYETDTDTSTREYQTVDDVEPEIGNVSVTPKEVDPEGTADIEFDAEDAVALDDIWVEIERPNGLLTDKISVDNVGGTTYSTEFSDTSNEGSYTVYMKANDSSGNTAEALDSFSVDPGGGLTVLNDLISFENITYSEGSSSNITVNLTLEEEGNLTNISASSTDSSKIDIKDKKKSCGNISAGGSCEETFNTTVLSNSRPGTEYVTFTGTWNSSEGVTSVSGFSEIDIKRNPQIEIDNSSDTIRHGESTQSVLDVTSKGNFRVENIKLSENGGSMPEAWTEVINGSLTRLNPGETHEAVLDIETPEGVSPDTYSRDIILESDNTETKNAETNISIPVDTSYELPSNVNASTIKDATGLIEEIPIESTGNVDYTVKSKVKGDISPLLDTDEVDLDKQERENVNLSTPQGITSAGNYSVEIETYSDNPEYSVRNQTSDVDLEVVDFRAGLDELPTVEKKPGENSSIDYNVTLDGGIRTENLTHKIKINGTEVENGSRTLESGRFYANFTVPEAPDAREHDLTIEITDNRKDVTTTNSIEDRYSIPDMTPPSINQINVTGTEPDENTSITVKASDNSLTGVDQVESDIESLNKTINLSEISGGNWNSNISLNSSGRFTANVSAEDQAGNIRYQEKRFRIANRTDISSSLSSWDRPESVNMSFIDSFTGEVTGEVENEKNSFSVKNISEGSYNVSVDYRDYKTDINGVNITENTTGIVNMDSISSSNAPSPDAETRVKGLGVETLTDVEDGSITFSYPADGDFSVGELKVARCPEYDYENINCNGDFEVYDLSDEDINRVNNTVTVDVPGFSSFTLFVPEDDEGQQQDPSDTDPSGGDDGGGGDSGGGGSTTIDGGISEEELDEGLNELEDSLSEEENNSVNFGSNSITARIKPGETKKVSLSIENTRESPQEFTFSSSETVSEYMNTPENTTVQPGESEEIEVTINSSASERPNSYSGYLNVESGEIEAQIPVNINIQPPNDELLDLSLTPVFESVKPGDDMKVEVTLNNQGYARNVDVAVNLELVDPDTNETLATKETTYAVGTTLTRVVNLKVPEGAERKQYEVVGTARYTNLEVDRVANAITTATVSTPFWERTILGVTYGTAGIGTLAIILTSLIGYSGYAYYRKKEMEKKRYLENIDLSTIPSGGNRQGYLGQLAEMGKRTFIDIDDLKTHALIAGATGSGKTVTGQVMVEEALEKGTNVIVLDPTAQWTGFLRENEESEMLQLLQDYGLSLDDARAYDGNIRAVEPDEEDIDITPYLEEDEGGNIIIFSLHKLDSKNIEEFVDKTIQQIFDANLPERENLETLVVYDEVHRLLEKFGGTGEGLKQLERGAREFRKWGVGMVLLSQVISDFSGEIRANIGTTVQMRTQYDDDLERMKNKFGIDTVKSIAKAKQGSGMLENSDYNHGRPYFVDFRPLKHSPHRLSDEELDDYEEYNRKIDEYESKIEEMEESGEDVYELRNKIKLARRNLRKGSFSLIEIYLDELEDDIPK